jgi:ABC-2 type transport system permease protein
MSRNTLLVLLYELRRGLRRRGYLFATFGIPLLALAGLLIIPRIVGSAAQSAVEEAAQSGELDTFDPNQAQHYGYVDQSGVFAAAESIGDWLLRFDDEAAARAALDTGEIDAYYLIPPDYLEDGTVTSVMPSMNLNDISASPIRQLAYTTLTEGLDPTLVRRIAQPANFTEVNLSLIGAEENGGTDEDSSFLVVYVFALALMISLFFTSGYLMQSVIEEKETRLIEILVSALRPIELLTGKIVGLGVLGLLQMLAWIGGILLAVRIAAGDSAARTLDFVATIARIQIPTEILPLLMIYFVLAYLMFAALYGIVGALSNSLREGPQYGVIFSLPAVLPLYFLPLFTSTPDGALPTLLSLIPLTAPLAMTQRLVIAQVPIEQIALSLALLAAACAAALWLAGRLFRMQTLLAGQPIKLRELPRLLRG